MQLQWWKWRKKHVQGKGRGCNAIFEKESQLQSEWKKVDSCQTTMEQTRKMDNDKGEWQQQQQCWQRWQRWQRYLSEWVNKSVTSRMEKLPDCNDNKENSTESKTFLKIIGFGEQREYTLSLWPVLIKKVSGQSELFWARCSIVARPSIWGCQNFHGKMLILCPESQGCFNTHQDFSTTPAGKLIFDPKNSIKSKICQARQACSSHHQIVVWICFWCICQTRKKYQQILRRQCCLCQAGGGKLHHSTAASAGRYSSDLNCDWLRSLSPLQVVTYDLLCPFM